MRSLKTKDIVEFARIIKKAKVKDRLAALVKEKYSGNIDRNMIEAIGLDGAWTVFEIFIEKEQEELLYKFFADIKECTPDEFANMNFKELEKFIKELTSENDLMYFFEKARNLM